MPASVRSSVVLPAPLPPINASLSPLASVNEMSRSASTTTRDCLSWPSRPDAAAITVFFRLRLLP